MNFKKKIGKFTLKDDSDVDEIKVGSYFAKKLQHGTSAASLSTAASARDASSSIRLSAMTSSPSESVAPSLRKADRATTLKPKDERSTAVKREPKNTETSSVKRREDPQASLNSSKQSNKSEATMRNEEGTSKRDLTQEVNCNSFRHVSFHSRRQGAVRGRSRSSDSWGPLGIRVIWDPLKM